MDGIHGTPYIAAPWILWDIEHDDTTFEKEMGAI
jgi:hypothetical protein